MDLLASEIARVCHEANRAYCVALGDFSQPSWDDAPEWQWESAVKGVQFCMANPDAPPSANHDSWLDVKRADGWKYGPVKDAEKKEHPCFVPYADLPDNQKRKDALFKAVVSALA
jgi:RyR domain